MLPVFVDIFELDTQDTLFLLLVSCDTLPAPGGAGVEGEILLLWS